MPITKLNIIKSLLMLFERHNIQRRSGVNISERIRGGQVDGLIGGLARCSVAHLTRPPVP